MLPEIPQASRHWSVVVETMRKRRMLTREQLAAKAGLSISTIQKIEMDRAETSERSRLRVLRAMCPLLGQDETDYLAALLGLPPEHVETFLNAVERRSAPGDLPVSERMVALLRKMDSAGSGASNSSRDEENQAHPADSETSATTVRVMAAGYTARSLEQLMTELVDRLGMAGTEAFVAGILGPMRNADRRAEILRNAGQGPQPANPPHTPPHPSDIPPTASLPGQPEQRRTEDNRPYVEQRITAQATRPGSRPFVDKPLPAKPKARKKA